MKQDLIVYDKIEPTWEHVCGRTFSKALGSEKASELVVDENRILITRSIASDQEHSPKNLCTSFRQSANF
jgi:hypothetical protein